MTDSVSGDTRARSARRFWIATVLALQVFVLVPGTIYIGNLGEFAASTGSIITILLIAALALLLATVLCGGFLERRRTGRFVAVVAAIALLSWVQSYLLVWDYGALDGDPVDWQAGAWRGWLDGLVWIGGIACAARWYRRLERPLLIAATVVLAAQSAVLAISVIGNRDALQAKQRPAPYSEVLPAIQSFSTERNVVQIILDSFQTDIVREIVSSGTGERYRRALDGFVFYEENLGIFPYTYFAVPAIVSGRIYRNDEPKQAFFRDVFSGHTILNAAHDAGVQVDIATVPPMFDMMTKGRFANAYLIPGKIKSVLGQNDAAMLIDLALFRIAPHFLKRFVYNDQRWLSQQLLIGPDYTRYFYFAHNYFLNRVADGMTADRTGTVYKFFHIMSAHAPMVVNPDCSYTGRVIERNRATVIAQTRCTLEFVVAVLEKMKQLGIYDKALIVLLSDHGSHIPPDRYRAPDPDTAAEGFVMNPWTVAMASSALLVKQPGARGPLRRSGAPTWVLDTMATIDGFLELPGSFPGRPVGEIAPGEDRERQFYYYPWRKADYVTDYILPIQEFRVRGSLYENGSWRMGARFPPPQGAE